MNIEDAAWSLQVGESPYSVSMLSQEDGTTKDESLSVDRVSAFDIARSQVSQSLRVFCECLLRSCIRRMFLLGSVDGCVCVGLDITTSQSWSGSNVCWRWLGS